MSTPIADTFKCPVNIVNELTFIAFFITHSVNNSNKQLTKQGIVAELVAAMSHDLEIVGSSLGSGIWKGCVIILAIVPNIRVSAWIYDVQIVIGQFRGIDYLD